MNFWEDQTEPYPTTQKTYFRTWKGMPLRKDWNSMPMHQGMQQCIRCGYKWGQTDFEYMDGSFTNGSPNPVAIHATCWNCWMSDTNHAQVRSFWDQVDRTNNPPGNMGDMS